MADAYYLDTSALVKRYVSERGSESIDQIFTNAHSGEATIASSYWNVGEAAVVFDKYGRVTGLDAKKVLHSLLRELKTLSALQRLKVVRVTHRVIMDSIEFVLKHHLYVADAIQLVSFESSRSTVFVTADKKLSNAVTEQGWRAMNLS